MKIGENGISSNGFERKFRCDLASSSVKILVASTKSSNIAGIPVPGLLGLIRERLVEFRLDFLAFPSLVDIPPVFGLCSRRARPCCFWFFGYRKWPPSVSLGLALGLAGFLCRLRHVVYDGETE